ncbi:MAG TPA: YetF domain-containing protein [Gemmata sp.]
MFFDNWAGVLRAVVVGVLAYGGLLLLLRAGGKRTLAKMNAFDLVVTVALGSTLATVLLTQDVALLEGLVGFGVLIVLQFVVTWLSVRSATVRRLVRAEPSLLYFRGQMLPRTLTAQRVTESEVLQAVRASGHAGFDQVEAVVLESDGTFSVVSTGSGRALRDVPGAGDRDEDRAAPLRT